MLLFIVKDSFQLTGLGIVLTPGLGNKMAKVGDKIKLVRPDKTTVETTIQGMTFATNDILIGGHFTKEDVPVGTEVWLVE